MSESPARHESRDRRAGSGEGRGLLRKQVVVVLVGLVVGLLGGLVVSLLSPHLYAGEVTVRVFDPYRPNGSEFGQVDPATVTSSELQYAESGANQMAVENALDDAGVKHDSITWTPQTDSASLQVRCLARGARDSARCANIAAQSYVDSRSDTLSQPLTRQARSIATTITQLQASVARLQTRVNDNTGPEGRPTDANRGRLSQQTGLLSRITQLSQSLQAIRTQAGTVAQNYQVVSKSEVPDSYASPLLLRNLAVGAVAGLVLGALVAASLVRRHEPREPA